MPLFISTLRALGALRRAVPIAVVMLPLLVMEQRISGPRGAWLAALDLVGFLLIGPFSYRALFPRELAPASRWARFVAFGAVGLAFTAFVGRVLPGLVGARHALFADTLTLEVALPLFWAGSWALGRDIDWEARVLDVEARNQALAQEAERAQLMALRAHLDPHFLFNTLNAIAEWCREDAVVAERATLQLSRMLRTILSGVKSSTWPMEDEITLVTQLLELHRTRDPERYTFDIQVEPEAARVPLPPMLVLSLVENAVKHGPAAGHDGKIVVRARVDDRLHVTIENPGPFGGPREGGEGLPTVEKRLRLAYDGRASMRIEHDADSTRVVLVLPRSDARIA